MTRKYKKHYDKSTGKMLKPIFDGWGNFKGWLDISKN